MQLAGGRSAAGAADAASPPVSELLVHLVGAQQTFVLRTRGRQHEGELERTSQWPGIERLQALAEHTSKVHRTEAVLTLGAAGVSTPELDGWAYVEAVGYGVRD
jgi:hypothetical protein